MRVVRIIYVAMLLVFLDSINAEASTILNEVSAFETKVYPMALRQRSLACAEFLRGFQHEPDEPDYLQIDCAKYRRTLACYQDFQKLLGTATSNGKPVEKDLSTADRTKIERACRL